MQRTGKKLYFRTKSNILINNFHPSLKSPITKQRTYSIINSIMNGEKSHLYELTINFTDNKEIRKINKKYLNHNFFTDIITFPYNNDRNSIEGEIFISLDTVKENAKTYNTGYKQEFTRVLIHGCLHLTGYNDKTKKEQELIRYKENCYMSN